MKTETAVYPATRTEFLLPFCSKDLGVVGNHAKHVVFVIFSLQY